MNRRYLLFGALFTLALIVGVAWYGERTQYRAPAPPPPGVRPTPLPFTLQPDPPVAVETNQVRPVQREEAAAPELPDLVVVKPTAADITVPVEPPPAADHAPGLVRIPQGVGDGRPIHAVEVGQLDQAPAVKYRQQPVYPQDLRQQGATGTVLVDFIVDPNGNVRNAYALRSTNRGFEEPAAAAVGKWKFSPGRKAGFPVYVHMQVSIVFTLNDGN
jgi:protein TonB